MLNVKLGIVVAAGGSSLRFGGDKLFANLGGRPVFMHCISNLASCVPPEYLVLVASQVKLGQFQEELNKAKLKVKVICGGKERYDSVMAGLNALPSDVEYVAVQDAARPLTGAVLLERCLESAKQFGSGVAAHHVTDTIKVASDNGVVQSTPDRKNLWAAETPQVFRLDWLLNAYHYCQEKNYPVTDDAQAVQYAGHDVHLVENTEPNLKITRRTDLAIAGALIP